MTSAVPTNYRPLPKTHRVPMRLASALFIAACGGESTGVPTDTRATIAISVTTTGVDLDADGYAVSVDGAAPNTLAINGDFTMEVAVGAHTVALKGLASNCGVNTSTTSAAATAGRRTDVAFVVTCRPRQVAFSSNRTGSYRIYLVNRDGSNLVQLTNGANDIGGAWSPDGSKVMFTGDDANAKRQVFVVDADGNNRRQLTADGVNRGGTFSPDGRSIVFTSARGTGPFQPPHEVYLMDADGGNQRRITFSNDEKDNPQWSPDGMQLAWTMILPNDPPGPFVDAYVSKADGTGSKPILVGYFDKRSPSWTPDGKGVVLTRRPGPFNDRSLASTIWYIPLDGTAGRQLTFNTSSDAAVPRMSPDGKLLAYSLFRGSGYELHVVDADGVDTRILPTSSSSDYFAVWRP